MEVVLGSGSLKPEGSATMMEELGWRMTEGRTQARASLPPYVGSTLASFP